jgi:hypothetical protein
MLMYRIRPPVGVGTDPTVLRFTTRVVLEPHGAKRGFLLSVTSRTSVPQRSYLVPVY